MDTKLFMKISALDNRTMISLIEQLVDCVFAFAMLSTSMTVDNNYKIRTIHIDMINN